MRKSTFFSIISIIFGSLATGSLLSHIFVGVEAQSPGLIGKYLIIFFPISAVLGMIAVSCFFCLLSVRAEKREEKKNRWMYRP